MMSLRKMEQRPSPGENVHVTVQKGGRERSKMRFTISGRKLCKDNEHKLYLKHRVRLRVIINDIGPIIEYQDNGPHRLNVGGSGDITISLGLTKVCAIGTHLTIVNICDEHIQLKEV
jgi:hypothetical protein